MASFIGISFFFLLFLGVPFHYTMSLLREPKPFQVPSIYLNSERDKCQSVIERKLYDGLILYGHDVETQVPCGKYRIDLTIPMANLAIECDGKEFHSTKEQKAHDQRKDIYLRQNGWNVLRFSGRKIKRNIPDILTEIDKEISIIMISHHP